MASMPGKELTLQPKSKGSRQHRGRSMSVQDGESRRDPRFDL